MTKKIKEKTVLVVGGGGRESALVYGYAKSPHVGRVLAVPGNDLMQDVTDKIVITFQETSAIDVAKILELCKTYHVDLVDIAQERAIEAGLGDALEQENIHFIGPKKATGQIEWDKAWARQFMEKFNIPLPLFGVFSSEEKALAFLDQQSDRSWVVKANGLTDGKGVWLTDSNQEARQAILKMKNYKEAGATFLLEEYLRGEEFSTYIISDGENWQILGSAQDHKLAFDNDQGPNTGGMGCSTPPLILTPEIKKQISTQIVEKTISGMKKIGRPYTGILYLGGMVLDGKDKELSVIEFNARWGDPEAQVLLPGLLTDLYEMSLAVAQRNITKLKIKMDTKARVVVAGTSKGYPDDYQEVIGKQIFGLRAAQAVAGVQIFGAAVKRIDGKEYANGGRLFYIVGEGKTVKEAREKAYKAMDMISIEGDNLHFRTDIGWRDLKRLK